MKTIALGMIVTGMFAWASGPAFADCECLANGKIFHHGEVACLSLPSGSFLARCDMELNNSSWKKMQDGCPEAAATPVAPLSHPDPQERAPSLSTASAIF